MTSDSRGSERHPRQLEQLLHELDQQDGDADGEAQIERRQQPAAGEQRLLQHALDRLAAAVEHGGGSWQRGAGRAVYRTRVSSAARHAERRTFPLPTLQCGRGRDATTAPPDPAPPAAPASRQPPAEGDVGLCGVVAAAGGIDVVVEALGQLGIEHVARLLEGVEGVGIHHLRPQIAVVAGRIAADDVLEVRDAVAHARSRAACRCAQASPSRSGPRPGPWPSPARAGRDRRWPRPGTPPS